VNTRKSIVEASLLLFNKKGVMNVTLRDVAKFLNKSYGNITYHFPIKDDVILCLLDEMNNELLALQKLDESENILLKLFNLPIYNYSISLRYLFFIIDYLEIKRNYPKIQKKIDKLNMGRKEKWMNILLQINEQNYFDEKITHLDLEYIMFLSYSVRVTYFQTEKSNSYNGSKYTLIVNNLLKPYLSKKGLIIYEQWLESFRVSK
jgi:AcrR family transcriptional regulator